MSFEAARDVRWIEVMPWLARVSPRDVEAFFDSPVVPDGGSYTAGVQRSVDRWMRFAPDLRVSEALPTLDPGVRFSRLDVPARVRNALYREGFEQVGDIAASCPEKLSGIRNFGGNSLYSLLLALTDYAARSACSADRSGAGTGLLVSKSTGSRSQITTESPALVAVIRDMRSLAQILGARGQADRSPLDGFGSDDAEPDSVSQLRARLARWSAAELFPGEIDASHCARVFEALFAGLDERYIEILRRRTFADTPETLSILAEEFGVTRERVRQIEAKGRASVEEAIGGDLLISVLKDSVSKTVRHVMPLQILLEDFPSLNEEVPTVNQPVWRILDRLDETYEIADGWVAAPTVAEAVEAFRRSLAPLGGSHGLAPVSDVRAAHSGEWVAERRSNLRRWLEYCGLESLEGVVILGRGAMLDRALAVLAAAAEPLSAEAIHDRIAIDRSLRSLKNQMGVDDRFVRVGRNAWALAEWGIGGYTSIREAIREVLDQNGGEAALGDLADAVADQYGVRRQSVLAYAMSHPFTSRHGVVSFEEEPRTSTKAPENSRRVYRRGGSWLYRVTLGHDHMRGSGFLLPSGLARAVELIAGGTVTLEGPVGPQAIYWTGMQPSFGSIRSTLEHRGLQENDEVFLILGDDGTFDIELVRDHDGSKRDELLAAIGTTKDSEFDDLTAHVAAAVGVGGEALPRAIQAHLSKRGEPDLVLLVAHVLSAAT